MQKNKIAVVTGGSRGIGRAAALALKEKGFTVYELSRHGEAPDGVAHMDCDVSDAERFSAVIGEIVKREGRIDVLVNNAGFGISGAAEFTPNEDAKRLLDVNLFGMVNGCRAVIPYMREQGNGRIINLSSVAAVVPIPFQAWYSVSKAAVNSYTSALQNELIGFGISLCAVMPGDIRTGFTAAREKSEAGAEVYGLRIRENVARMEHDEETGMAPETAGRLIARLAVKKRIKPEYTVGGKYRLVTFLVHILPCGLRSRIIGLLYAGGKNAEGKKT